MKVFNVEMWHGTAIALGAALVLLVAILLGIL